MIVYTSITKNYLPKARVLAKSLKKYHPDWHFAVIISDSLPQNFNLLAEPFDEVVTIDMLPLSNLQAWTFGHDLVELCTAVKGPAAKLFASRTGVEMIMYLDPDIKVFSSLNGLIQTLNQGADILLTPHLLHIESNYEAILDNELSVLKHGIFNLGFFAAKTKGEGLKFINWWSDRLELFCLNDIPNGLFTDQKWCDEAPAFFEKLHIVRDTGCNVATWNIAHRPLSISIDGKLMAGDVLLKFYHFTGYDSGAGAQMLNKYAGDKEVAQEVWTQYQNDIVDEGHAKAGGSDWQLGFFEGGELIPKEARRLYRNNIDLQVKYPNPYSIDESSFYAYWKSLINNHQEIHQVTKHSLIFRILRKIKREIFKPS
jgi:hypothetical protein